jgi:hypothetical protein
MRSHDSVPARNSLPTASAAIAFLSIDREELALIALHATANMLRRNDLAFTAVSPLTEAFASA